ncbi:MAG: hypothetical protein K0S29_795 [Gammaproteobacteria bacterium]|nr:hypothetical protein [Gammaproteobacteria bacterium]
MKRLKTLGIITMLALPLAAHADWIHQYYAGIGTGFQFNDLQTSLDILSITSGNHYNYQFSNKQTTEFANLMFGLAYQEDQNYWAVEADAYYNGSHNNSGFYSSSDTTNYDLLSQMPWRFELDGVYGRYFNPKAMAYLKVGATTGQLKATFNAYNPPPGGQLGNTEVDKQLYGGLIGLGIKYTLNPRWVIGAEADYIQFFNASLNVGNIYRNFPTNQNFKFKNSSYLLKAYISYLF